MTGIGQSAAKILNTVGRQDTNKVQRLSKRSEKTLSRVGDQATPKWKVLSKESKDIVSTGWRQSAVKIWTIFTTDGSVSVVPSVRSLRKSLWMLK